MSDIPNRLSRLPRSKDNRLIEKLADLMETYSCVPVRVIQTAQDDLEYGEDLIGEFRSVELSKITVLDYGNKFHMLPDTIYIYDDVMEDPEYTMDHFMDPDAYQGLDKAYQASDKNLSFEEFIRQNVLEKLPWQDVILVYVS